MIDGIIAISSRAPFNLDESHAVYESGGEEANCRYQIEREDEPLDHGIAVAGLRSIHAIGLSGSSRNDVPTSYAWEHRTI